MLLILVLFGLWAVLAAFGLRGWLRLAVVVLAWGCGFAAISLAPEGAIARLFGDDPRVWLVIAMVIGLVLGYRGVIEILHRKAERGALRRLGGAPPPRYDPEMFSPAELDRYARHIVLRELGGPGQQKLRGARVLIVGAGALGSPVALYLAAAGVGRITIADDDRVSLSNLQRQVMFTESDLDRNKAEAATARLAGLNPNVSVTPLTRRIGPGDVDLIRQHDLVLDGTDSYASRAGVNRACVAAGVPLVGGSIAQWEGQLSIWDPVHDAPCLACIFPQAPAPGLAPSCAEAGVIGALPGVIGSMMVLEAIKLICGAGSVARGRMVIFDGLWGESRSIGIARNPSCPVCGSG